MQRLGFDIFDDIVDHSYQALENPIARVNKSILLNKDILSSFTITPAIQQRLEYNLDLMSSRVFEKEVEKQLNGTNLFLDTQLDLSIEFK